MYIAYDRDDAGERAAEKLAEELLAMGMECYRVQFPKGMDANEFALKVAGSVTNSFRYTGREFDTETSLYYYRARYYDPSVGRFVSEDKRSMGSLKEFLNLYVYVLGDPVNFSDPLGLWTLKPDVDYPSIRISALLDCIEWQTGLPLLITSTSDRMVLMIRIDGTGVWQWISITRSTPNPGNPGGDLPKNPICKGCKK